MRDLLESVASGDVSVDEAEAALRGYVTNGAGRFDAARESRRGIPEGILAEGKTPAEVATLAEVAVESTGHALVTRVDDDHAVAVERVLDAGVAVDHDERAGTVVAHGPEYEPPSVDATVTLVSGGTADAAAVGEAAAVLREMGVGVETVEDVGVAHLGRVVDELDRLRSADVLVVAAGREGALPTVVAGLVDVPVIGLPVSTGYGAGGDGLASLLGMLQSCTVLSVTNVDAGFVAGSQAGLIARSISNARNSD